MEHLCFEGKVTMELQDYTNMVLELERLREYKKKQEGKKRSTIVDSPLNVTLVKQTPNEIKPKVE